MFLLGLLLPTSYWPGLDGWTINTAWPVLSIILPFYFLKCERMTPSHWLGLSFLAYVTLSLAWAPVFDQGIWDLWLLAIFGCGFLIGASDRNLRRLYLGMGLGVGVSTIIAIFQWIGFHPVAVVSDAHPSGLFFNFDVFGEVAALATVALIVSEQYWPLILTIPPIFFTSSRTALVAVTAALCAWLWDIYRWRSAYVIAPLATLGCLALWLHGEDGSIALRLSMWRDTIAGLSVFGSGPGSFFMGFPIYATHSDTMAMRPEVPHNDFLLFFFQYGIGCLPLAAILWIASWSSGPERYILAALLPITLLGFPSIVPAEGFLFATSLGRLCMDWNLHGLHSHWCRLRDALQQHHSRRQPIPMESLCSSSAGIRGSDD